MVGRQILAAVVLGALCGCVHEQNYRGAWPGRAAPRSRAGRSAAPEAAAAVPVTPEPERPLRYTGVAGNHWVTAVRERGARVQLEDQSVWAIPAEDWPVTQVWLVGQKITVTETPAGAQPYRLTNADRNTSAAATLVSDDPR